MRALKMRSIVASHWNLTMKNWEQLLKLILLLLHKKLPKNSMSTILWLFSIWSKLERWKTLISGCLMSWPKLLKKSSFWSVVFSYSMQQQQTISWHDEKWILYDNQQWPASGWTKKKLQRTSQSQTFTKSHHHYLVVCCGSDPSESWWNHYIWEVCSANWWDAQKIATPTAGTGQ